MILRNFWIGIVGLVCLSSPCRAEEWTQDQWRVVFEKRAEWAVDWYYTLLGKVYTDTPIAVGRQTLFDAVGLFFLQQEMDRLFSQIQSEPAHRAAHLRRAYLVRSQAKFLASQITRHRQAWDQMKKLRARQCSAAQIDVFAGEFSVSAAAQARLVLDAIHTKLGEMLGSDSPAFEFSLDVIAGENGSTSWSSGGRAVSGGIDPFALIAVGTLGGQTVGHFYGPIGTGIGALVGGLTGRILSALFGESPKHKWTRIYREQSDRVIAAADSLRTEGVAGLAASACTAFVSDDKMEKMEAAVTADLDRAGGETVDLMHKIDATEAAIHQAYRDAWERLVGETLPLVKESIHQVFEEYFAQSAKRSLASKVFAGAEVAPALRYLLQEKADQVPYFDAEQTLWNALIEGDTRFSAEQDFTFSSREPGAAMSGEVLYWDPAVAAILEKLKSHPMGGERGT